MTLQIPAGEVMLTGDLEIPEKPRGLVLFAHGSGSGRQSPRNQAVAEVLRDAGMATLLFDLLTPHEEIEDAYSGHLRFDIGLLSRHPIYPGQQMDIYIDASPESYRESSSSTTPLPAH